MNSIAKLENQQHKQKDTTKELVAQDTSIKVFVFDGDSEYAELNERMRTYQPPVEQLKFD